jgi:hypothetical protein
MSDDGHLGIGARVRAALRGGRRAGALDALRRAGVVIYGELAEAEEARAALLAAGGDVWTMSSSMSGHMIATWNAFALQTLGESLLGTEHLPPATFEQAWTWLATASEWLNVARQASANPQYDATEHFRLPADPPELVEAGRMAKAQLTAMVVAVTPLREHVELALYDLERCAGRDNRGDRGDRGRQLNMLRQLAAEAVAAGDYAASLCDGPADDRLRAYTESHLERAIVLWFHLGQLAAMPALIGGYRLTRAPTRLDARALPGGQDFDPWCLTCPQGRARWKADPRARLAVSALWSADPDPAQTLGIQAQIDRALADGDVAQAVRDGRPIYYFGCPWPSIYRVRHKVRLGGRRLTAPQLFTLHVEATRNRFIRQIVVGPFDTTAQVRYGD